MGSKRKRSARAQDVTETATKENNLDASTENFARQQRACKVYRFRLSRRQL
jgi:hypothetical protein